MFSFAVAFRPLQGATVRILLSILLLLALLPSYSGEERVPLLPADPAIRAERVALDWLDPARARLGGLTFLGGVALTSPIRAFGGFSAMTIDGDRFTLLSDGGNVVQFRMDSRWQVDDAHAFPLSDGPGSGWTKLDRDSEALTRDPDTGRYWVAFERANQIWRYDPTFRRAEAHAAPREMAKWPTNGGAEGMARLRDGSFIVLAENQRGDAKGYHRALWFAGDPTQAGQRRFTFNYRGPKGYKPTDIAELPDGRLIVVNRRASLQDAFTAIITTIDRPAVRPGARAIGREIARFAAPVLHDNFEAVAAVREGRDTILWLASDDNQYAFQRSLLLKFRLDETAKLKRRTARIP